VFDSDGNVIAIIIAGTMTPGIGSPLGEALPLREIVEYDGEIETKSMHKMSEAEIYLPVWDPECLSR
jgi:nitrogen-specific signal transduction histidine kinase